MLAYYQVIRIGGGLATEFPELRIKQLSQENANDYDFALSIGELTDESLKKLIEIGDVTPPSETYIKHTYTVKSSGLIRYCAHCKLWKPDRCHHCSSCKTCVLKMDHHCPWFATCIGFRNHKFFIQFLGYTVAISAVCGIAMGKVLYDFIFNGTYLHAYLSLNWVLVFIFGAAFSIAVGAFLGFSVYQLVTNKTTLETYDYTRYRVDLDALYDSYYTYSNKPNSDQYGNLFDLSLKAKNWKVVMGENWFEWVFPVENKPIYSDFYLKNGLCFTVNQRIYKELVNNSKLQRRLAIELNNYRMRREAGDQIN